MLDHLASLALLGLLGCGLVLTASLQDIGAVFGVKQVVPPAKAAGVVADELFVVQVVVVSTSPERKEVVKAPWELVATVGINGLEETQHDPNVHCQDMQVTGERTPHNWTPDSTESKDHNFNWRSIFSSQAKGSGILVVNFVDGFVKGAPVESTV